MVFGVWFGFLGKISCIFPGDDASFFRVLGEDGCGRFDGCGNNQSGLFGDGGGDEVVGFKGCLVVDECWGDDWYEFGADDKVVKIGVGFSMLVGGFDGW